MTKKGNGRGISKVVVESMPELIKLNNLADQPKKQKRLLKRKKCLHSVLEILQNLAFCNIEIGPPELARSFKTCRKEIENLLSEDVQNDKKVNILARKNKKLAGGQLLSAILSLALPVLTRIITS